MAIPCVQLASAGKHSTIEARFDWSTATENPQHDAVCTK